MDNKICEYNTIGHTFPNDECVMCTFPISSDTCDGCIDFVDKIVKESEK